MWNRKKVEEKPYPSTEFLEKLVEENDPEKLKPSNVTEIPADRETISQHAVTMVEQAKALQAAIDKEQACIGEIVTAGRVLDEAQKKLQEARDNALRAGQVKQKLHRDLTEIMARVA